MIRKVRVSPRITRRWRSAFLTTAIVGLTAVSFRPAAQSQTPGAAADILILNGRVYAGAGAFHEAVAIQGSTILQVGRSKDLEHLRGPSTSVIDARGRAVVPGLNDSHVHFLGGGLGLQDVDLAGLMTLQHVQQKIGAFAKAKPDAPWVRGHGWLYSPFPGGLPTREQLDKVVPDRPAVMMCYDGHSVWVNSKALQLAGITKDTPNPINGIVVKDPTTGEPTGVSPCGPPKCRAANRPA